MNEGGPSIASSGGRRHDAVGGPTGRGADALQRSRRVAAPTARQAAFCQLLIAAASAEVAASHSCIGGQSVLTLNSLLAGSACPAADLSLAIEFCTQRILLAKPIWREVKRSSCDAISCSTYCSSLAGNAIELSYFGFLCVATCFGGVTNICDLEHAQCCYFLLNVLQLFCSRCS